MNKITKIKYFLIALMWFSALIDIATFYLGGGMVFETNPFYLMTGSAHITVAIKIVILFLISILFIKVFPYKRTSKRDIFNYSFKMMHWIMWTVVIYLIIAQTRGAIDNLTISAEKPSLDSVMSKEKAMSTYISRFIIPLTKFIVISILIFVFYNSVIKKKPT